MAKERILIGEDGGKLMTGDQNWSAETRFWFYVNDLYQDLSEHLDTLLFQASVAPAEVLDLFKKIGDAFNKEAQKGFIIKEYGKFDISKAISPSKCHFNTEICTEVLSEALAKAFAETNLLDHSRERDLFTRNEDITMPLMDEYLKRICRFFSAHSYCRPTPDKIWDRASIFEIEHRKRHFNESDIAELGLAFSDAFEESFFEHFAEFDTSVFEMPNKEENLEELSNIEKAISDEWETEVKKEYTHHIWVQRQEYTSVSCSLHDMKQIFFKLAEDKLEKEVQELPWQCKSAFLDAIKECKGNFFERLNKHLIDGQLLEEGGFPDREVPETPNL